MLKLTIVILIVLSVPLFFILAQRKQPYIYIRGAKISSKYWRLPVFAYIGAVIGVIVGLISKEFLKTDLLPRISIIVFVILGVILSLKNTTKND